jgi:hypothetical protein
MSTALQWIFETPPVFANRKRQLFILTDGEDFHPDQVMSLICANRSHIRCFTIGFGRAADPGLVKGIATRTNGRFDFVYDGVDLRSKVLSQLLAALSPTIDNIAIQISGTDSQTVVQCPIQPMIPDNLSTTFIHCQGIECDWSILTTGNLGDRDVEYLTEATSICSDESMIAAVSKYTDMIRLIDLEHTMCKETDSGRRELLVREVVAISIRSGILSSYTSFVGVIQREAAVRERPRIFVWTGCRHGYVCIEVDRNHPDPRQYLINALSTKCEVSPDSLTMELPTPEFRDFEDCQTVICKEFGDHVFRLEVQMLTGRKFVIDTVPETTIQELKQVIQEMDGPQADIQWLIFNGHQLDNEAALADYNITSEAKLHCVLMLKGGGGFPDIQISEIEPPCKLNDVSEFLNGHSVEGCWINPGEMIAKSGLVDSPELPHVDDALSDKILATVLALALLRKRYNHQRELWALLELKAVRWLLSVSVGSKLNWTLIIDSIVAMLT